MINYSWLYVAVMWVHVNPYMWSNASRAHDIIPVYTPSSAAILVFKWIQVVRGPHSTHDSSPPLTTFSLYHPNLSVYTSANSSHISNTSTNTYSSMTHQQSDSPTCATPGIPPSTNKHRHSKDEQSSFTWRMISQ